MTNNKRFFFVFWIIGGFYIVGQAAHYFIGGETYKSSGLRDFLVVAQLLAGLAVAFYGWKKFRLLNDSKS